MIGGNEYSRCTRQLRGTHHCLRLLPLLLLSTSPPSMSILSLLDFGAKLPIEEARIEILVLYREENLLAYNVAFSGGRGMYCKE